ncbi:conserved hypothetical protein [uncultured delta proteobacterium]|uniref:Methyltransferase type 12 domain-containing protein n=1 Tax=uncultured delta proteobacterium TaxID=34034 RepID=A0A212KHG8_9DELT|nr:conserved hypothetical protein [uncultured delta proteobacterium]
MVTHPSLAGYAEESAKLVKDYEEFPFDVIFANFLHAFPQTPCRALDIGAGTGRHAAALARRGHAVVAVEPTRELREAGKTLHGDVPLTWVDDTLPGLAALGEGPLAGPYGLVLMAAVLMHFDAAERDSIIRRVAELLAPGGRFILTLRHGPVPSGRRMFSVPYEEVVALSEPRGLRYLCHGEEIDHARRPGVSWTMLCLEKTTT